MNVFFDVDYTILAVDGSLRPRTREVFEQLVEDGHNVYVWSGVGLRNSEVQRHGLSQYVTGVYQKPLSEFEARLNGFGIGVRPDLVVDDYPEIVDAFGGVLVRPYYFRAESDDEMERVYRIVSDFAINGSSEDAAFRPRNHGPG